MSETYKASLPLLTPDQAQPDAAESLRGAQKAMGMIPNMYAAMANSPGVLLTYQAGYERFRRESGFTPVEQEVVFLVVSRGNGCRYCVSAHSFVADQMSKVPVAVTDAIRDGKAVPDPKLEALARFTQEMFEQRGNITAEQAGRFQAAGYGERHILEIVLAIAVKTLSNYTNHLFHTPLDAAFAGRQWNPPQVA